MNKRRYFSGLVFFSRAQVPAFMICSALFALGIIVGTFLSAGFCDSGGAEKYMAGYLASLAGITDAGTAEIYWTVSKYTFFAFLLGFSALGTVGVPALCFLRGFSLAFSLSVLTRLYSINGVLMGYILFGAVSALSIPVFLTIASGAFLSSVRLGRTWFSIPAPVDPDNGAKAYFLRFSAALLFLFLLALGEKAVLGSGLLSLPIFS